MHEPNAFSNPLEQAKIAAAKADRAKAEGAHEFHYPAVQDVLNRAFPKVDQQPPLVVKHYPCGCSAGPGPADMPDYCPEHGTADDTSGCVVQAVPNCLDPQTGLAISGSLDDTSPYDVNAVRPQQVAPIAPAEPTVLASEGPRRP